MTAGTAICHQSCCRASGLWDDGISATWSWRRFLTAMPDQEEGHPVGNRCHDSANPDARQSNRINWILSGYRMKDASQVTPKISHLSALPDEIHTLFPKTFYRLTPPMLQTDALVSGPASPLKERRSPNRRRPWKAHARSFRAFHGPRMDMAIRRSPLLGVPHCAVQQASKFQYSLLISLTNSPILPSSKSNFGRTDRR